MDGFPGAGEGGTSAQGPSSTYKYGVTPGKGANKEDLAKKKRLPTRPVDEQGLPANERVRPRRKRVVSGTTSPPDRSL
jgi:hypothetical protein